MSTRWKIDLIHLTGHLCRNHRNMKHRGTVYLMLMKTNILAAHPFMTLRTTHLLEGSLPLCQKRPIESTSISIRRLFLGAGSAKHYHCFCLISVQLQIHTFKKFSKNSETILDCNRITSSQMTIIGVETCCCRVCAHTNIPLSNNSIDDNIKNKRRNDISLPNSTPCRKRTTKISTRLWDNQLFIPNSLNNRACMRTHTIGLQNRHCTNTIQGVVGF
mmetsp:Transcript_9926/g.18066  ORF Transcript_9926/g.18066 Transcript_9926/m.18066 type:complete len:217 (+) Transcript_9926:259-909(+)